MLSKRRGRRRGRAGMRNHPSARRCLSVVTCFLWVPRAEETVMQATECWWQKHLRCPVSRQGVHTTSPVSHCPWLYDSVCLLLVCVCVCAPLRNQTIPTVYNTIWSTHHLNNFASVQFPLSIKMTLPSVRQPMHPPKRSFLLFSISTPARKSTSAILTFGSLQLDFVTEQNFTFEHPMVAVF